MGSVRFERAWDRRVVIDLEGLPVPVIGRDDLIVAMREAGRPQDLADVAELERPAGETCRRSPRAAAIVPLAPRAPTG